MQQHFHAIVWLDHLQARIFHLGLSGTDEVILHPQMPTRHIHHKANSIGSGHVHDRLRPAEWIEMTAKPLIVIPGDDPPQVQGSPHLERLRQHYAKDTEAARRFLAAGEAPRQPALDPAEHAAYAALCLAIFNLDETLTRE